MTVREKQEGLACTEAAAVNGGLDQGDDGRCCESGVGLELTGTCRRLWLGRSWGRRSTATGGEGENRARSLIFLVVPVIGQHSTKAKTIQLL